MGPGHVWPGRERTLPDPEFGLVHALVPAEPDRELAERAVRRRHHTLSLEVFNAWATCCPRRPITASRCSSTNTTRADDQPGPLRQDEVCTCGIVTRAIRARLRPTSRTRMPTARRTASPWSGSHANNASAGVFSTQYSPSHVNEDGPNRWNGESNVIVGAPFYAPARRLQLRPGPSSRVQNRYRAAGPHIVSLTIQGTGAGHRHLPWRRALTARFVCIPAFGPA